MEIEIVSYIKEARQHGLQDQEIKQNLLDVGWNSGEVEDSFSYARLESSPPQQRGPLPAVGNLPVQPSNAATQFSPAATQTAKPAAQPAGQRPAVFPAQTAPAVMHVHFAEQDLNSKAGPADQLQTQPPATPKFPGQPAGQTPREAALPPGTALSDTHFGGTKPAKKIILAAIGVIILAALGAGGYFAYANFINPSPAKIWNNFAAAKKNPIGKSAFNINYSDPGVADSSGKTQPFTFSLKGTAYSDTTNASTTVGNSDLTLGYQIPQSSLSAAQSGSVEFKLMVLGKVIYADLSNIPGISQAAGQQINWIKLDLDEAEKFASSSPLTASYSAQFDRQKQIQAKMQADLANILKNKQVVTPTKMLGSETVSGVATYHLQNQVDKSVLKTAVGVIFDDAYASSTLAQTAEAGAVKQVMISAIDKITIADFETWTGKKDSQLYKIHLDLKFPGVASWADGAGNPLGIARSDSRDAKRIADVRQMAAALELYYNDHNGYPASQNGQAIGIAPKYIGSQPVAPQPSDGDCSDYYNAYWYLAGGTPTTNNGLLVYPSYTLTFCLGGATGSYPPGLAKLTPEGIQGGVVCNDTPANCHKQADVQQPAPDNKPAPQADLTFDATYSDYGKKETVTAPANALDLIQYIQQQMGSGMSALTPTGSLPNQGIDDSKLEGQSQSLDSKRLADMEQLASALELYYNDKNQYPNSLNDLVPKYIAQVPTAPVPPGGNCNATQNSYNYSVSDHYTTTGPTGKTINSNPSPNSNYEISFCLGGPTSSYNPGIHSVSPFGIK